MAENYVLLETINLTSNASSVTFDNIPQTGYTDLKVVVSARTSSNSGVPWSPIRVIFNGSYSNWQFTSLYGIGNAASTGGSATENELAFANSSFNTANGFSNSEFYIQNYTSSNHKLVSSNSTTENNAASTLVALTTSLWANTSAVTSMTLPALATDGSFVAGSTFSLYGIAVKNTTPVTSPFASGGNVVANDGTYWYHAFMSSGYFVPQKALTCDILQVAGGGGGGGTRGGGGGAGGVTYNSSQSLTATSYTVQIGAGGIGAIGGTPGGLATQGGNTLVTGGTLSLTAANGGGYGGTIRINNGSTVGAWGGSGGSGGGGALSLQSGSYTGNGGSATPSGQGYGGGNIYTSGEPYAGGGGGGAGSAGANGTSTTGGNGGTGTPTYSSWGLVTTTGQNVSGTVYYAGGGGGSTYNNTNTSTGGSGGGGAGGTSSTLNGAAGVANTGGGGGGAYNNDAGAVYTGGQGGSGIVIIRYPMAS
jgi:hypothetical protein